MVSSLQAQESMRKRHGVPSTPFSDTLDPSHKYLLLIFDNNFIEVVIAHPKPMYATYSMVCILMHNQSRKENKGRYYKRASV